MVYGTYGHGSVLDAPHKRKKSRRTDEDIAAVKEHFGNDPHCSTRRASLALEKRDLDTEDSQRLKVASLQGAYRSGALRRGLCKPASFCRGRTAAHC